MSNQLGSFIVIFQIFGFCHRKRSLSHIIHISLLLFSIINAVTGFLYVKFPGEHGITDLVGMFTFYLALVTHFALMVSANVNWMEEIQIFEGLDEFDETLLLELHIKPENTQLLRQRLKLVAKILSGWLMVVLINIITTISVINFGFYTEYWMRALLGRVSSYLKVLQILLCLECLKSRYEKIENLLTELQHQQSEEKLMVLKKLFGKLFEISIVINKRFLSDLTFMVIMMFFVMLTNFYWGCLIIAGLEVNSSIFGN